ncbi:hypothetical protein H920_00013 [Fukomys damarensis]|uniref:Uncharacterized protein n=1 Tax=Fukomys damarensis TaxID=885580 RepID=A0A091E5E5_FUKDA|nr:hypothetical protein H920_00013 [Fukomys damarensis]
MTCSDINQELNFQLEESQQQLRDMEANFHIAKATLYVLAAELRKFKHSTVLVTLRKAGDSAPHNFKGARGIPLLTERVAAIAVTMETRNCQENRETCSSGLRLLSGAQESRSL